ncbi:leucine-rich repeat and calponin homology domain-containing protein 1 isoform X1 [Pseudorca crassidens]|uniref:leucine-rich repeat and calponin homology domain-containing protein 1 isoform X1 n=1 Tax=Pseudorca crassidens TaxID=82174 RepID=UPI00352D78F9
MATPGSEPQPFVPALSVATLHPHHHPPHHHHHHHHGGAGGSGGAGGGGGGGGGGGFNLPLNRGLERALEEAANSGGLNLSARKLKEFPRTAAPAHDLSDTVQADLSKNRLVEVPMELCHFVSLEILNLYHNCIRVIPEAIINLQMLTYLNLSRNQLSTLPACLCGLPLKVLIASNNKLGSLPEEIGQLKQLMELDVSCNEITALPQQIGQLKSLRELNVRRNYLKVLPQELVDLPLVKFDFSCNKVLVIPICFREMKQLQVLLLENNPLQSPPAQICTKGKVHIFKYLSIQACQIKTTDSLYLHTIERPHLHQHVEDGQCRFIHQSLEHFWNKKGKIDAVDNILAGFNYPLLIKNQSFLSATYGKKDSDSGVGSDNGDKRLSATEPSDEDTVSLNVPMSNIMEEEQQIKEDSCHRLSPVKGEFHQEFQPAPSLVSDNENSGEERDRFSHGTDILHSEFINYIKERTETCEELLRIEEDAHWPSGGIISSSKDQDMNIAMIEQLREAVDLLQDPNRLSTDITERSVVNFYPVDSAEDLELQDSALNGQIQLETSPECEVQNDLTLQSNGSEYSPNEMRENSPAISPTNTSTALFGLKPRSDPALTLPPISFNKLTQAQTWDNSSYSVPSEGDSDNVFLRPQRNLESIDPQFTIRRKMEQMREEKELVEQLRESIEMRLKVSLHEDLGAALMDGVVLCHLVNHIRPRSVASIHVPSPAVPKLSMAKCRRNVENFLEACRKLGVPEADLCSPYDILQLDFRHIRKTVDTLLALGEKAPQPTSALRSRDLISFCLVHILFVVLIYITYRWNVLSA